jgi:hypothetical protein
MEGGTHLWFEGFLLDDPLYERRSALVVSKTQGGELGDYKVL